MKSRRSFLYSISFISLLPILFFSLFTTLSAQEDYGEDAVILQQLDPRSILTTLFESSSYSTERGVAWTPDLEERMRFTLSDDGMCYTALDTILEFQEELSETLDRIAIVIFSTYSYYGDQRSDCHACAPEMGAAEFVKTPDGWVLMKFHKYLGRIGSWGLPGQASLQMIGPDHPALVISSGFTAQGYTESYSTYYDVWGYDELSQIFTLRDGLYGPAGCEEECGEEWCQYYTNITRTVVTVPNDDPNSDYSGYDHIQVNITEKTCQGKEKSWTELYKFSDGGYSRVCE